MNTYQSNQEYIRRICLTMNLLMSLTMKHSWTQESTSSISYRSSYPIKWIEHINYKPNYLRWKTVCNAWIHLLISIDVRALAEVSLIWVGESLEPSLLFSKHKPWPDYFLRSHFNQSQKWKWAMSFDKLTAEWQKTLRKHTHQEKESTKVTQLLRGRANCSQHKK